MLGAAGDASTFVPNTLSQNSAVHKRPTWTFGRLRPLRKRVRRGETGATDALAPLVGAELANTFVDGLCRARYSEATVPKHARLQSKRPEKRTYEGPRYSVKVQLDAAPIRTEDAPEVTGPVRLMLHILDHVRVGRDGQKRAWTKALWLGPKKGKAAGLANALGVSRREIQRWLAALRTIGFCVNWQPDGKAAKPREQKNRKGRSYGCYHMPWVSAVFTAWHAEAFQSSGHSTASTSQSATTSSPNPTSRMLQPLSANAEATKAAALAFMPKPPS